MTTRDEYKAKIRAAKEEMMFSGPIHAKDLWRQINRMEKELKIYDRYQQQARISRERATASSRETV